MDGGQTTTNAAPAGNSSDFVSVDLFDNDIDDIVSLYYYYIIVTLLFLMSGTKTYTIRSQSLTECIGAETLQVSLIFSFLSLPLSSPVDPT